MKYLLLVLSVMLFGCAQTPPPTSMNTTDWQSFGEEMALKEKPNRLKQVWLKPRLHHQLMQTYMPLMAKVMKWVKLSIVLKTRER